MSYTRTCVLTPHPLAAIRPAEVKPTPVASSGSMTRPATTGCAGSDTPNRIIEWSPDPAATSSPPGWKAMSKTRSVCPAPTPRGLAAARSRTSHIRNVLSKEPLAKKRPSGLNATLYATTGCPASVHCPAGSVGRRTSIRWMAPLSMPAATVSPSGLNATPNALLPRWTWLVSRGAFGSRMSHRPTVLSKELVAKVVPSGLRERFQTVSVCCAQTPSARGCAGSDTSHSLAVPSCEELTRIRPEGSKTTWAVGLVWAVSSLTKVGSCGTGDGVGLGLGLGELEPELEPGPAVAPGPAAG